VKVALVNKLVNLSKRRYTTHKLFSEFRMLPSGHGFNLPRWRTKRLKNSLVPAAIGLLNSIM